METRTNHALLNSGLSFLNAYANQHMAREEKITVLEEKLIKLQPMVDEAAKIAEEIKLIRAQNKSDEKFLMNMNEVILAETGEPISNGELFDAAKRETIGAGNVS